MAAISAWLGKHRVALVLTGLVVLAVASSRIVNGLTEYRLTVPLDTAEGLYPGSDVLIAGAHAGSVRDITVDGAETLVTIALDDAYAPVHSDARVTVRPKSLLGEKYVALEPGLRDTLASGSRLPQEQVARSVDLQDVVNTLDQPTREKLRTLIVSLGGGLAGQGLNTNQTIANGRQDMDHLAAITNTLAARDADLQQVIEGLDQVTAELAKSDRRLQLGTLIQNSETLLHSLSLQDAQIKQTLTQANAALARTDSSLSGTATQLNHIFQQAPRTVDLLNGLSADLGSGMDQILKGNNLQVFDAGMKYSSNVFGARANDGTGYATRISVNADACSAPAPCTLGPSNGNVPDSFSAVLGILLGGQK
ncbi:MAG: MlaD family protein [Candidatus Dormibacteraeota bacterium]|nr:MlaD family protein [Candidatus Dormibacteraeota bacterium]